ncbi:HAD family hydrolase [Parvularcula oceani]|uniref:HAD family hydrolase n=1 Tax=Parvularcula oceani TaxID=1247963 RepID=UPI0004E1005E|nr:HAD-IA family hydrolase [Parvularcula oceani]
MPFPHAAILFDCDGVLVDSEIVGLEDAAAFLSDNGFDWTTEDFIRHFAGMRHDAFAHGLREAQARVLGRPPREEEVEALIEGVIAARRAQRHTMKLVPGAEAMVAAAARVTHASLAVASSSGQPFLDDKVERYGLKSYFGEHVYSADRVAHGKPEPDIFLYAAEQLGVSPKRCLVIEDSAHGVRAGVAAGMTVWGFTGGGHCLSDHGARLEAEGAHRIVGDHETLRSLLAES